MHFYPKALRETPQPGETREVVETYLEGKNAKCVVNPWVCAMLPEGLPADLV